MIPSTELLCQAKQIERWTGCSQSTQMSLLAAIFANLAKMTLTCESANALAQQFACVERQLQLPLLIALANQIVQVSGQYVFSGIGSPIVNNVVPALPNAIYFDNTNLSFPIVWQWQNNLWTAFIGA